MSSERRHHDISVSPTDPGAGPDVLRLPQGLKDPSWDLVHVAVEEEGVKVHGGSRTGHSGGGLGIPGASITGSYDSSWKRASLSLHSCFVRCSCRLSMEQQVSQQVSLRLLLLPDTSTRVRTETSQKENEMHTAWT